MEIQLTLQLQLTSTILNQHHLMKEQLSLLKLLEQTLTLLKLKMKMVSKLLLETLQVALLEKHKQLTHQESLQHSYQLLKL